MALGLCGTLLLTGCTGGGETGGATPESDTAGTANPPITFDAEKSFHRIENGDTEELQLLLGDAGVPAEVIQDLLDSMDKVDVDAVTDAYDEAMSYLD